MTPRFYICDVRRSGSLACPRSVAPIPCATCRRSDSGSGHSDTVLSGGPRTPSISSRAPRRKTGTRECCLGEFEDGVRAASTPGRIDDQASSRVSQPQGIVVFAMARQAAGQANGRTPEWEFDGSVELEPRRPRLRFTRRVHRQVPPRSWLTYRTDSVIRS